MEDRKYETVTAEAPPEAAPQAAEEIVDVPPLDSETLARIEAKLDALLYATGAEVAGYGSTD